MKEIEVGRLYSRFHAHKAVTYHEPTVLWLFMIGHSLGRVETCFGPSTQGAEIRYQNTSQIQILLASHFEKKKGAMLECEIDGPANSSTRTMLTAQGIPGQCLRRKGH